MSAPANGTHAGPSDRTGDPTAASARLLLLALALIACTAAAAVAMPTAGDNAFMVLAIAGGVVAVAATRTAERMPAALALWIAIGVALIVRVGLIVIDPLLSTDVYRYVWDGKVQAAGINPYRYLPASEALAPLRDAIVYPNINRPDYATTIYPPVAQMFFLAVTRLGENVTTMKAALVGCDLIVAAITVMFLKRLGKPIARVTAYLWHPLPLWQIANNGHVDALMTMLMMLGLWLALTGRSLRGTVAVTLGALAKPFAVIALPMTWRPWDWKAPVLVVVVVALCYLPYLAVGWGVFGFLTGYLREEGLESGRAFWALSLWREIFGVMRGDLAIYVGGSILAILALGLLAAHRHERPLEQRLADFNNLLLVFLLLLSPVYPWYLLMLAPFAALRGGAPNWVLSIGAFLLQDEVAWDFYVPLLIRQTLLYGTFLAACAYEIWQERRRCCVAGNVGHELASA